MALVWPPPDGTEPPGGRGEAAVLGAAMVLVALLALWLAGVVRVCWGC